VSSLSTLIAGAGFAAGIWKDLNWTEMMFRVVSAAEHRSPKAKSMASNQNLRLYRSFNSSTAHWAMVSE
jgi:hypothetical protein